MVTVLWGVDLNAFIKVQKIFEAFRKNLTTDQGKAGAVQALEFSYELALKTMKRLLEKKGLRSGLPGRVSGMQP